MTKEEALVLVGQHMTISQGETERAEGILVGRLKLTLVFDEEVLDLSPKGFYKNALDMVRGQLLAKAAEIEKALIALEEAT